MTVMVKTNPPLKQVEIVSDKRGTKPVLHRSYEPCKRRLIRTLLTTFHLTVELMPARLPKMSLFLR